MKKLLIVALIIGLGFVAFIENDSNEDNEVNSITAHIDILNEFTKLEEIPRESGHMNEISNYLRTWAKDKGFVVVRDNYSNVIITQPASKGYEDAPTTILQVNMDMPVTTADGVTFNPKNDSIQLINDGETLKGDGTNLGAASGIGISTAMYILSNAQNHGPLKVIFTANKETTMAGAKNIDSKYLEGDYLINLAANTDTSLVYGNADTYSYEMTRKIQWTSPKNTAAYLLSINGLNEDNSRFNAHAGGGNAIKAIGEVLALAQSQGIIFELASFIGGSSDSLIPAEASALVVINDSDIRKFEKVFKSQASSFKKTYGEFEKNYQFTFTESILPEKVISGDDSSSIIAFTYGELNGVQSWLKEADRIAESASNLSMVSTLSGKFISELSTISYSPYMTKEIEDAHQAVASLSGMNFRLLESTPGWMTKQDRPLPTLMMKSYSALFTEEMKTKLLYESLECGWFAQKNPKLQIISVGVHIINKNSPDETLYLDSIEKPAILLQTFLEQAK